MIKIPKSICVNTGGQSTVQPTIDSFIEEVYETLVDKLNLERGNGRHPHFERRVEKTYYTKDCETGGIYYLKYRDRVVAIVLETRTELNYVQYDFFLNIEGILP